MSLHPVIRIICFLIIVIFLARLHLPGMLLLTAAFFIFAFHNFSQVVSVVSRFAWRLRWFWLSILVLYSLMPLNGATSPGFTAAVSLQGLQEGLIRCLSLLLVIMYFVLLIHPIALNQLQQAWAWLMQPLRNMGINPDVFSLRLALTFHAVRELQSLSIRPEQKLNLRQLPERLFNFLQLAIEKSTAPSDDFQSTPITLLSPGILQWLFPIGLLGMFLMMSFYQLHIGIENIYW